MIHVAAASGAACAAAPTGDFVASAACEDLPVQSMLTDPGQEPREGSELRRFVARWLGPAILYPRMSSLSAAASERSSGRPGDTAVSRR